MFSFVDPYAARLRRLTPVLWLFPALFFSLVLSGCNSSSRPHVTTVKDVRDKYRGDYAALSRRLAVIADNLPPAGSIKKVSAPVTLDPKPVYYDRELKEPDVDLSASNTGILSAEELHDQAVVPENIKIPVGASYPGSSFALIRESSKEGGALEDKDGWQEQVFKKGLALRYLIVYRVTGLVPPTKVKGVGSAYTPGALKMEVFLVDLKTDQVAASFPVAAKTPKEIKYTDYYSGSEVSDNLISAAISSMAVEALPQMATNLAKTTGGTFKFYGV